MTTNLQLNITDSKGNKYSQIDFAELKLSEPVANAIMRAFVGVAGHTSVESRRQFWRSCRKFAAFLHDVKQNESIALASDILENFRIWLSSKDLAGGTKQTHFNAVASALQWCSRNISEVVPKNLRVNVSRFKRQDPVQLDAASAIATKAVLTACYSEIEIIEKRIRYGRSLLDEKSITEQDKELAKLITDLMKIGNGSLPKQKSLNRCGQNINRRVALHGGLRVLDQYISPKPRDVFPFYLAILIQTAGNPMAILNLNRNCVVPHDLLKNIEMIVWEKPRASSEQMVDFPVGKEWSAPNLIRKLMALNKHLQGSTDSRYKNKVFLSSSHGKITVPCFQLMHLLLAEFEEKHNLIHHTFKAFRKTNVIERRLNGKSLIDSTRRLNHKDARTTVRYANSTSVQHLHDSVIVKYQGILLAQASKKIEKDLKQNDSVQQKKAGTVFGFDCADPLSGVAPGSQIGKACNQFSACATCPGAVLVLDDPKVVLRIIESHRALMMAENRALKEGWIKRFEMLYKPTLEILKHEILPAIAPQIILKVESLIDIKSIPRLE